MTKSKKEKEKRLIQIVSTKWGNFLLLMESGELYYGTVMQKIKDNKFGEHYMEIEKLVSVLKHHDKKV